MNLYKKIWFSFAFLWIILGNIGFSANWNLPGVTIISRAEWGADETIRFRSTPKTSTQSTQTSSQTNSINYSKIRNAWMAKNFPNEWKYEGSNLMFGSHYLIYPEYFNHNKNKIAIHHTAMDYDSNRTMNDVKSQIQKIYKYHTINRNFGDIGYNFLIDQMGNIYEGRAGGEGAVGMHVSSNNVSSIGIALMGNFENTYPSEAQLSSLITLVTALAKYYNIDPLGSVYTFKTNTTAEPYVTSQRTPTIFGHKDAGATACPGKSLYQFIPAIREEVNYRLKNNINGNTPLPVSIQKTLSALNQPTNNQNSNNSSTTVKQNSSNLKVTSAGTNSGNFSRNLMALKKTNPEIFSKTIQSIRSRYVGKLPDVSATYAKISRKYNINEVKYLMKKNISVLLYELTTKYDSFNIKCDDICIFKIDGIDYYWTGASLTFLTNKIQVNSDRNLSTNSLSVRSLKDDGIVEISNYSRKSYAGIPWNKFKGYLIFEKGVYMTEKGEKKSDFIVYNTLPFSEYMKGIVETNDTESLEKNKVMAMIAKNYALFYLNGDNIHPSVPQDSNYNAIDDPDFFQKYVGAGLENTLTKRYQALKLTENKLVMYDDYLPILPYFSCSPGFTLSAQEKWGWNDTPYLQPVLDFYTCGSFAGHGVGLSGKGAERLAQQGMTYDQILEYYYNGIKIVDIN